MDSDSSDSELESSSMESITGGQEFLTALASFQKINQAAYKGHSTTTIGGDCVASTCSVGTSTSDNSGLEQRSTKIDKTVTGIISNDSSSSSIASQEKPPKTLPSGSKGFIKRAQKTFPVAGIICSGRLTAGRNLNTYVSGGQGSAGVVTFDLNVAGDASHTIVPGGDKSHLPVASFVVANEEVRGKIETHILSAD